MSALHRLKAYFGMVPAEEFNVEEFDSHYPAYHSGYPEPDSDVHGHNPDYPAGQANDHRPHRMAFDDYADGFANHAGHYAPARARPPGSLSWTSTPPAPESRAIPSPVTGLRTGHAPVCGSLAIDATTSEIKSRTHHAVAPQRVTPAPRTGAITTGPLTADPLSEHDRAHPLARIVTLHPHSYNEARPIGERYREGNPVIINLTGMEDRDAKRLVDFAAGLAFALRGSIDKVTNKVFLLSPPDIEMSAEDRRRIAEGHLFL